MSIPATRLRNCSHKVRMRRLILEWICGPDKCLFDIAMAAVGLWSSRRTYVP
jgi:hypothetical protein